jgi:hypothetical protein
MGCHQGVDRFRDHSGLSEITAQLLKWICPGCIRFSFQLQQSSYSGFRHDSCRGLRVLTAERLPPRAGTGSVSL